jgi:membrane-associated protein
VSSGIDKMESERRFPWRWRRVVFWAFVAVAAFWALSVILEWLTDGDGLPELNLAGQEHPYLILWGFVTFDAVIPILPSESLLNAASTLASQGQLELGYIIVAGALGAIVGDSLLYWLARTVGRKLAAERLEKTTDNPKVAVALEVFGETAPLLIVAGRFVPGVRFVVNATMGLHRYSYPRFLLWSVLGAWLWAGYTCVFSWWIGTKIGDWPILSIAVSAVITGALLGLLYFPLKRRWQHAKSAQTVAASESPA